MQYAKRVMSRLYSLSGAVSRSGTVHTRLENNIPSCANMSRYLIVLGGKLEVLWLRRGTHNEVIDRFRI